MATTTIMHPRTSYTVTACMLWLTTTTMLLGQAPVVHAGIFVDDLGVSHNLSSTDVFALRAFDAISLYHFGLPAERLGAVFYNWLERGSSLNLDTPAEDPLFSNDFVSSTIHMVLVVCPCFWISKKALFSQECDHPFFLVRHLDPNTPHQTTTTKTKT